jgi:hypothetical protein
LRLYSQGLVKPFWKKEKSKFPFKKIPGNGKNIIFLIAGDYFGFSSPKGWK